MNVHGGDDYLAVIDNGSRPATLVHEEVKVAIEAAATNSGMVAEVMPVAPRVHATFYRSRGIMSNSGGRHVPQFGRVLSKLPLRANSNQEVNDADYISGKLLCAAYEHRNVPVIRDILSRGSQIASDSPNLRSVDKFVNKIGASKVTEIIEETQAVSPEEIGDFCREVYDLTFDNVCKAYNDVVSGMLDYLHGFQPAGKGGRREHRSYVPPVLKDQILVALTKKDLGL